MEMAELGLAIGRVEGRLQRIEGRLDDISNIANRVSTLEMWQAWLKGGWAAVLGCYVYLSRSVAGR